MAIWGASPCLSARTRPNPPGNWRGSWRKSLVRQGQGSGTTGMPQQPHNQRRWRPCTQPPAEEISGTPVLLGPQGSSLYGGLPCLPCLCLATSLPQTPSWPWGPHCPCSGPCLGDGPVPLNWGQFELLQRCTFSLRTMYGHLTPVVRTLGASCKPLRENGLLCIASTQKCTFRVLGHYFNCGPPVPSCFDGLQWRGSEPLESPLFL